MKGSDRCQRYVDDVLSGKQLAPLLIKLACKRFNSDIERKDIYFDEVAADNCIKSIEALHHAKGRWQGSNIHLEDWQCFFVANVFGWKWTETDLRRFRYFYLRTPRKQGKTLLCIAVAIVMFGPDQEPGAEVYLGGTSLEHARDTLFAPAKYIIEHSPEYRKRFGVEINATSMVIPANFSQFKAVIKKPDDGANPSFALCDEFHLADTNEQYAVFDTGMGSREGAMLGVCTTAGANLDGPCHQLDSECIKILEGHLDMDSTFAMIYAPDEGDDWSDADTFRKVNPNLNVSISEDYLLDMLSRARVSAQRQSDFRTKHTNEWVGATTVWMNMLAWQKQKTDMRLGDFAGESCHVAIDLAEQKDVSSIAVIFKRDGKYYGFCKHFVPESAFEWNDKYKAFALGGHIETTPGNAQDYGEIKKYIESLADRFTVKSCVFDPWQANQMMQELLATGLEVHKFTQQFSSYSDPMKTLETAVLDGNFYHNGDPVLTWMMGNMAVFRNKDDHIKPVKENPNNPRCKIDGGVALIMAMKAYTMEEERGTLDSWLADPVVFA